MLIAKQQHAGDHIVVGQSGVREPKPERATGKQSDPIHRHSPRPINRWVSQVIPMAVAMSVPAAIMLPRERTELPHRP